MLKKKDVLIVACGLVIGFPVAAMADSSLFQAQGGITIDQQSRTKTLEAIGQVDTQTGVYTDTGGLDVPVDAAAIARYNSLHDKDSVQAQQGPAQAPVPAGQGQQQQPVIQQQGQSVVPVAPAAPVAPQTAQQIVITVPAGAQATTQPVSIMAPQQPQPPQQRATVPVVAPSTPVQVGPVAPDVDPAQDLFGEYDANNNGVISEDEFYVNELSAFATKMFADMDADKNGWLDSDEFSGYQKKSGQESW